MEVSKPPLHGECPWSFRGIFLVLWDKMLWILSSPQEISMLEENNGGAFTH